MFSTFENIAPETRSLWIERLSTLLESAGEFIDIEATREYEIKAGQYPEWVHTQEATELLKTISNKLVGVRIPSQILQETIQ